MGTRIEGSVVLVSGANRGIGRALVEALLRRGAARVYAGARRVEGLSDVVAEYPDRVVPIGLDVTDAQSVEAAAAQSSDINMMINNAGVATAIPLRLGDALQGFRHELNVNVLGLLGLTQAVLPTLLRNGGAVVNIASLASLVNFTLAPTYGASKAAAHSLTQALRMDLAGTGIQVSAVYPGPVDTDMSRDVPFEKASATEVADAILDGVEAGDEEIFPDAMARELGALYFRDPKALEKQVAAMIAA